MSKNIKIININDIEEIVLSKHELDLKMIEDGTIEKKMTIQEYFEKYATPTYIYVINDIQIPFIIHNLYDTIYLFVADDDKDKMKLLLNKLKLIRYDINNLVEQSFDDLLHHGGFEENDLVIIGNKYYK